VSANIPTVVSVDWTTTLTGLTSGRVVYSLNDAESATLNRGGAAPADLTESLHHTLLLGLKPQRSYSFHVEVESPGVSCRSDEQTLATGSLADAPAVVRYAAAPAAQAGGFIVTSSGFGSTGPALILDADGSVVWTAPAPASCSRARFDFEAKNLWMLATNPSNAGGELRSISLDGSTSAIASSAFGRAHHDFTALPGGRIAVLAWSASGLDPESDLLVRNPDGSAQTLFHVGSNLYEGGPSAFGGNQHSYHSNSVSYHPADDSFTIGDRNPSAFVKVSSTGTPEWQFGGHCEHAKAPLCAPGTWDINHGHQLLADGTFLFFNNTAMGHTSPSNALEFLLDPAQALVATSLKQWSGSQSEHSDTLGDVQRLPNGDTLVTFSNDGIIYELDANWAIVQTLTASSFGYSEWRPTLYGPPTR
jgi:hypothetical protein